MFCRKKVNKIIMRRKQFWYSIFIIGLLSTVYSLFNRLQYSIIEQLFYLLYYSWSTPNIRCIQQFKHRFIFCWFLSMKNSDVLFEILSRFSGSNRSAFCAHYQAYMKRKQVASLRIFGYVVKFCWIERTSLLNSTRQK